MRKAIPLLTAALMVLLLSGSAYAFGPVTHEYILDQALNDPRLASSSIAQTIKANRACCDSGMTLVDLPVIYYYTNWANYDSTHNWNFQKTFLASSSDGCELAIAYCAAAHDVADSVSHHNYIPFKNRDALFGIGIPNAVNHPLEEARIEARIIRDNPQTFNELRNSLNILDQKPYLLDKIQSQVKSSTGIVLDVKYLTGIMREAIASPDGFYTRYFALPGLYQTVAGGNLYLGLLVGLVGIVLAVLNYIRLKKGQRFFLFSITWLPILVLLFLGYFFTFGGLAGISNTSGADLYLDMAVDRTADLFTQQGWVNRGNYDVTGFEVLRDMDAKIYTNYAIGIAILAIITALYVFVVRPKLKRKKR